MENSRSVFKLEGPREMLTETRTKELLEPLLAVLDNDPFAFNSIDLSNKSYDVPSAKVMRDALVEIKGIRFINFSDTLSARSDVEAVEVLQLLSLAFEGREDENPVEELNLSDNALGYRGIKACVGLLETFRPTLQVLIFNACGLEATACELIVDTLTSEQASETQLRKFHIFNNLLEDAGAIQLKKLFEHSPHLEDVRVATTRCHSEGCIAIAEGLMSTSSLKRINLGDNGFGVEGGEVLSRVVEKQNDLLVMNLGCAGLEDGGMKVIASALEKTAACLNFLDISCNDLTWESCSAIAEAIKLKEKLKVLKMEENEIGSNGMKILVDALVQSPADSLEELDFNCNEITASCAADIARMIQVLPRLQKISLDDNMIHASGVEVIQESLESVGKSNALQDMSGNDEDYEED